MTSKKRRRHTPDQIIRKLTEGNKLLASGQELDAVCRHFGLIGVSRGGAWFWMALAVIGGCRPTVRGGVDSRGF